MSDDGAIGRFIHATDEARNKFIDAMRTERANRYWEGRYRDEKAANERWYQAAKLYMREGSTSELHRMVVEHETKP